MASSLRIGHGYDVHRLVEGRRCIIGGVDIPHDKGLLGHSDADVLVLLARVMEHARGLGYEFVDADCTLACQEPKITPHREQMRENLARAIGCPIENVGVKATTTERLGWEGEGEGIGAWAVCLLERCI